MEQTSNDNESSPTPARSEDSRVAPPSQAGNPSSSGLTRSQRNQLWILLGCAVLLLGWFYQRWSHLEAEHPLEITWNGPVVRVEIEGDVERPGVYELPPGSVLADLVARAGAGEGLGELPLHLRSLALREGTRIGVWRSTSGPPTVELNRMSGDGMGLLFIQLNLNNATQADLEALPGIGPGLARAIIADRDANGPYARIEDLDRVKGVGPSTIEKLRFRVIVAPPEERLPPVPDFAPGVPQATEAPPSRSSEVPE